MDKQLTLIASLTMLMMITYTGTRVQGQYVNVPEGAATLAFVFDVTGSMYDDLIQVIDGAAKILAATVSRREQPLFNYVLVPFHDPVVGPIVNTTDPDEFQFELGDLHVQGGGDCPEMAITAIREAIDISLPNSFIYVFTDARSKDFNLTEQVLALIQEKQSQVVFVLTGDCDDPGHPGYTAYESIASTSSGQVFLLKKSQVNEVLNFVRVAVQSRKVNLMSVDVPNSESNEFYFPVDSKLQELTVSVSGTKPRIILFDPAENRMDNQEGFRMLLNIPKAQVVNVKDPLPGRWRMVVKSGGTNFSRIINPEENRMDNQEGFRMLLNIPKAQVVNVKDPLPGRWRMVVKSEGKHTIRVTGLSTADFIAGYARKEIKSMKDSTHRPVGGIETHMLINTTDMTPPGGFSTLEVLDLYGKSLGEYKLFRDEKEPSLYRVTPFKPPEDFFYVKVSGVDDSGYNIQRLTSTAISRVTPERPYPYMPEVTNGYFGLTATLRCTVESLIPYFVTWYKEDVQIGSEQYFEESGNATVDIPSANQYSEGIYFCKADNAVGSRRIPTFLDITEPPPSITVPQNASVLPGQDALLTCNIFSTVNFNISWHRSGYRDALRTSSKFVDYRNGSLLVRNVQLEDEGMYVCKAANEGGQSKKSTYINVQVAPIPYITPSESNFVTGDTKVLDCKATGYPTPEILWARAGQLMVLNENVRIRGTQLTLRNMQRGDGGLYTCIARNPAGESRTEANLNYIEAPKITSYESRTLVAAGDEATLYCGAVGIPPPKIKWYKGKVELKALSYVQISDSGSMKIIGTQELDAGEYRCEAVNEAGTDSATLLLEVGSEPQIVQAPQNVGVDIGGSTTLDCRAQGMPIPKLFWKRKDGKKLDLRGKARQLPSGGLQLSGVGLDDEGSYVCVAQNQFGTTEASAFISITGIEPPLLGYMDPVISAKQGDTVELNCQVLIGNPPPVIQWVQYGNLLPTDEYVVTNRDGTLIIQDIQDFHDGDYICLASNVGGNTSYVVAIEVQVPPTFVYTGPEDEQTNFETIEGDRVVLPCEVEGDPRPDITWYKDESPISLTDYHYYIREDGSLEIYSAEATDTGSYRCQATNIAGDIEKIFNLFVQVAPTIPGEPSDSYIVIENQTVTLPCAPEGIPEPRVVWRKNFVPFAPETEGYIFGSLGLTIGNTKVPDKGIYECVATNVAGKASKVFSLFVHVPPIIYDIGPSAQKVLKGDEVTLNCNNTGVPTPEVMWKKNEVTISFTDDEGYIMNQVGDLLIDSAKVSQTGIYVCIVTNDAGVATRDLYLEVREPPSLPANLTTFKDIIEGNNVILRCPATGTPPPLITWYKDGSLITGDLAGLVILEDGSLQVTETDADDTATYKCKAENVVGKVEHQVDLKVYVGPYTTGEDGGQTGVIDNPKIKVTTKVTLVCPYESDPAPQVTWLKNGYELIPDQLDPRVEISEDGKLLTITDSSVEDTARYTCIAENIAGEAEKSFDLDVLVPPSIDSDTASPANNTVIKDNKLYLDCPVTGVPRPSVTWFKDGEEINPDIDPNIKLIADGLRLEIVGARVLDKGRYKCQGVNDAGTTETEFDVDVYIPPKVDNPGEINKEEIVKTGTVSLNCPVYGVPRPEITWYKNNQPIREATEEYRFRNNGWTLEIVSAEEADSARYTCRAKNEAGESEKAFELNVLVPPKIDRDGLDLNPRVMINQTTVINCPVDGIPAPTITWFKNGIQLDASIRTRYEVLGGGKQLKVRKAQLTDSATFECVAVNKAGSDKVGFDLFVTVPSKIQTYGVNTSPKVVEDGSLSLTCSVSGVPTPDIVWFKNGDRITEETANIVIQNRGMELIISNAEVDDTAIYTCRASNEAGESSLSYNVNVQVPPEIDQKDIDPDLNVVEGNSVVLNCPATGVPQPDIVWLKNGQAIEFTENDPYDLQGNGQRLVIEKAAVSDKGVYTCVAANEAGSTEQQYELDVWVKPEIDGDDLDPAPEVNKGHTIDLYCPVDGNPFPDIIWLKGSDPVQLDDRVDIQSGGQLLKIRNATVNDTSKYTCVARNPAGQDSISFDLSVFVPPSIDESNVVYYRKVVENRTIIIECPVSGIPQPEVIWLINDHPLLPSKGLRFTNNNYHLEIASAKTTDTAVYTCVATNAAGELKKNFDLEVLIPPRIDRTNLETDVVVIQNRTQALYCQVYSIPKSSIIWFKGKYPLLDWPYEGLRLSNDDQKLEIANAQIDDAGTYMCKAINPAGQDKQEFELIVHVPPEIAGSQFVSTVPVVVGSPLTLECEATGVPVPGLAWIKENEVIEIAENPHIRIMNDGRQLQIPTTEVTDTGRYVCHAENKAGISERTFDVLVQVPAYVEGFDVPQDVSVVINDQLILECPAEGIPPPKISWVRQGQIIQQYGIPSIRILDNGRRLLISSAQIVDRGKYRCFVENEAGNSTVDYDVSILVPPTISEGPTQVGSVLKTGAELLCESSGLPKPNVTWTKDGNTFPNTGLRHNISGSGSIKFTSVRQEDAGVYVCNASNKAGSVTRQIQLDVQVKPRMLDRQPLYIKAIKGGGVELPCRVEGSPTPSILWQKGATAISGKPGIQITGTGSLYLERTSRSDRGVYICIARNSAGTAFGQIRLQVLEPPKLVIREKEFVVNSGEKIVLPCQTTGRPRPQVSWKKDDKPIVGSNVYQQSRSGLVIAYVRPEDNGTYTCTASNSAGETSVNLTLNVRVKPVIGEASRLLTFTVGEDAIIECAAIGIPPPTVVWYRDGRPVELTTAKYYVSEFGTLTIRQLTEEDTGNYMCQASNVAGRAYQERLLRIQVPPSFIVVPKVKEILLNKRLVLRCTADGIPTPTIHWKLNDQPIQSPLSVNGRSVYVVRNADTQDAGVYTCIATNPAGEAETSTVVTVKVPPEILKPPKNQAVTVTDKVILPCKVGGDPIPEVIWMKNGRPVQLSERIQQLNNGSLVIYQSTSSDAGEYTCVATNDAGTSERVAMLTVREPPSFLIEPQHTRVDQGKTAIVDCVGDGEPEPTIDWMIGFDKVKEEGRLSVLPNSSLQIVATQLSDSGPYRCLASNNLGQSYIEINITVVVHGGWSNWLDWEPCSVTCGKGIQTRQRSCDNPEPANEGRACEGRSVDRRSCRERQCPVDGNWGSWLPWEPCSVSCDDGVRVRRRLCDSPFSRFGGAECTGENIQQEPCNLTPCAVDGMWSSWTNWQACSLTCGDGLQVRTRACDDPPPQNRGQFCNGSATEDKPCKLRECPVDGIWGNWGHWTPCSLSCGGGTRTRQRLCNNPPPQYGGLLCGGTDTQVDYCNNEPCPVHGGWSQWGNFGECSVSCNGGVKRRYRTCSEPPPSNNGRPCENSGEEAQTCNQVPCPVDGRWSDWSRWSECSRTCDSGVKRRTRRCREPIYGGNPCVGDMEQVMDCLIEPCYTIPIVAEGNLVGYINNIDIPDGTFEADMIPLPDQTATHVNATIRKIPKVLVPHFRHLISVLSPLYWTTAMEINGAYNGYSLTNGEFTREVQVEYATGEILKMSQYAKGVDSDGKLQLDVVLRGKVPDIDKSQIVKITPYWEQYLQTGPGTVHAHSTRMFHVSGFMLPYAWNHSITYENGDTKMPYLVQRLYARNMDIKVNPDKELVLFKLDTSIAPGSPSNQCPRGFSLNQFGPYCEDDDECARLRPCSDYCHNSPGSFACSCPEGFALDIDGRNCIDINECTTASAGCQGDEECINTIGSYKCEIKCRQGFRRSENGKRCVDINECEETPGVCSQICVNRKGSYRCRCNPGYRRLPRGKCADINECRRSSPCEQICANAPGSYQCSCKPGFQLQSNGRCRDINECVEQQNMCGPNQNCVNSLGSFRCITVCSKGSQLVQGRCVDVDECATGKHRCYNNQVCRNTDPGYRCLCPRGYRSTGPGNPCIDVDECIVSPAVCTYKCVNTHGDFECICAPGQVRLADKKSCAGLEFLEPAKVIEVNQIPTNEQTPERLYRNKREVKCENGYEFDSVNGKCEDINECIEDPGICEHECTNTVGSFTCNCPPGYRLSRDGKLCEDINECIEMNITCGPEKMCFNTLGEFTCIDVPCPETYQRDPITNYCVLECIDAEIACPENAKFADVIEFRTLALPSGIQQFEDLIKLVAYNQNNETLRKTVFTIQENDENVAFQIRLEDGIGIVYTPQPLIQRRIYKIKVEARSYDNDSLNIQYQTTFIIHIAVSFYPY